MLNTLDDGYEYLSVRYRKINSKPNDLCRENYSHRYTILFRNA